MINFFWTFEIYDYTEDGVEKWGLMAAQDWPLEAECMPPWWLPSYVNLGVWRRRPSTIALLRKINKFLAT